MTQAFKNLFECDDKNQKVVRVTYIEKQNGEEVLITYLLCQSCRTKEHFANGIIGEEPVS